MVSWPNVAAPHATWEQLRRLGRPVWVSEEAAWIVHLPEHVEAVALDTRAFANAVPTARQIEHDYLLTADGATHHQHRATFLRHFGPRIQAASAAAETTVTTVVETVDDADIVELVTDLCNPIGTAVGSQIIGYVDESDLALAGGESRVELHRLLERHDAEPSAGSPARDLLQQLVHEGTPPAVASSQVAGLLCAMLVAAQDTLPAACALTLLRSLRSEEIPDRQPLVADTPLLGLFSVCRISTNLGDVRIRAGDRVFVAWAAANSASDGRDYTFGHGVHRCPAARAVNELVLAAVGAARTALALHLVGPVRVEAHSHVRRPQALMCESRRA